jgi:hypothetical protein
MEQSKLSNRVRIVEISEHSQNYNLSDAQARKTTGLPDWQRLAVQS